MKWYKELPPTWQTIVAVCAILGAGFVAGGATVRISGLPEVVETNSAAISVQDEQIRMLERRLDVVERGQADILDGIEDTKCIIRAVADGTSHLDCL